MSLKFFQCCLLAFGLIGIGACTNQTSGFSSTGSQKKASKRNTGDGGGDHAGTGADGAGGGGNGEGAGGAGGNSNDGSGHDDSGFAARGPLSKEVEHYQHNNFWVVTMKGNVYYFEIEGDKLLTTKQWNFVVKGIGGARTYVTEGRGLVFAREGGHLYWIHPDLTPQGQINETPGSPNYHLLPGISGRGCIVSYRKNNQRFVGLGYDSRSFAEMAMENTPPYKPLFSQVTAQVTGAGGTWGYSCNIDQKNLVYYGAMVGGVPHALDLKTMTATTFDKAPNINFVSKTLPHATRGTANGSYAISGDRDSNLYNGSGFYTFAHEPKSNTVWGTSGSTLYIFPKDCLTKTPDCVGHAALSMPNSIGSTIGPLSALDNGYMVGIVRGAGQVYLMKLNDMNDPTKGITATRIATVDGDPYMYTDFTGATLYASESNITYDLSGAANYDLNKNLGDLQAVWSSMTGNTKWSNVSLEARCYTDVNNKPAFAGVASVPEAGKTFKIGVPSCSNQPAKFVDLRITRLIEPSTFTEIKEVQLTPRQ